MSNPNPKTVALAAGLPPPAKRVRPVYKAPNGRTVSAPRDGDSFTPPKPGWTVVLPSPAVIEPEPVAAPAKPAKR